MATKTAAKRRVPEPSPAPGVPPKSRIESRDGLWVVMFGRMKQYGDTTIERPGQVIRRQYLRNDDVLLKRGYVKPLADIEEIEQCTVCGLVFTGTNTSGPFRDHRGYARHDLSQTDLDSGITQEHTPPHRVSDPNNPDAETEWDLEPDGAPGMSKMEEAQPGGARISLGR